MRKPVNLGFPMVLLQSKSVDSYELYVTGSPVGLILRRQTRV